MSSYSFFFPQGINVVQLGKKFVENDLHSYEISVDEDGKLRFHFADVLTQPEVDTLTEIVANYSPIQALTTGKFSEIYFNLVPYTEFASNSTQTILTYYYYSGSIAAPGPFTRGYIVHNGKYTSGSCYTINVKMRDVTNGAVIFSQSMTGTPSSNNSFYATPIIQSIETISNLPEEPALFEISYQLTAGNRGRIYIVHVY